MKAALLSKVALCVCPPAMMATTAAYVPPVRAAVHHATRPHAKAPVAAARPQRTAAAAATPCAPAFASVPYVPLATFASPVPDDGVGTGSPFFGTSSGPGILASGVGPGGGGGGGGGGGVITEPTTPVGSVPEPSTWSMMLIGFGILGGALRSRRRPVAKRRRPSGRPIRLAGGGGVVWMGIEPIQAMTTAASIGSKTTLLAKAAMCLCPPALIVAGVATVPQVRKAVYAATAPRDGLAGQRQTVVPPCDPTVAGI